MKSFIVFALAAVAFMTVASESQAARRVRVVVRQPRAAVVVRQKVVAVRQPRAAVVVRQKIVAAPVVKVREVRVRAVVAPAVRVRVRVR